MFPVYLQIGAWGALLRPHRQSYSSEAPVCARPTFFPPFQVSLPSRAGPPLHLHPHVRSLPMNPPVFRYNESTSNTVAIPSLPSEPADRLYWLEGQLFVAMPFSRYQGTQAMPP